MSKRIGGYLLLLFLCGFNNAWIRFPGFAEVVEECKAVEQEGQVDGDEGKMWEALRNITPQDDSKFQPFSTQCASLRGMQQFSVFYQSIPYALLESAHPGKPRSFGTPDMKLFKRGHRVHITSAHAVQWEIIRAT